MTTKQRMSILVDRWPAACRSQGWNKSDRDLRLQVISAAVGRAIGSMNDLDNSADIDKVFAHLGRLADQVADTIETLPHHSVSVSAGTAGTTTQRDTAGYRRRLFWLIRKYGHALGGEPYVLALARDKFHITTGLTTIDDLATRQLHQLMMTLAARKSALDRKSKAALSSVEESQLVSTASDNNQPF